MENCFRIALGMFVLIGCLQARAINCEIKMSDLSPLNAVKCNVNFTTPQVSNMSMTDGCFSKAWADFENALENENMKCTDEDAIEDLKSVLKNAKRCMPEPNCNLTTAETPFVDFGKAATTLFEKWNTHLEKKN